MLPANDLAAEIIIETLEENLIEPKRSYPDDLFEERSYARWAAYELANRLMDRPYESPDLIIEEFMLTMMMYESATNDPRKSRLFLIAKETAKDILTLF